MHGVYKPVNPAGTDFNAIFTVKAGPDFIAPEALFAARIDFKNCPFNGLVLQSSRRRSGKKMLVIRASTDTENPAEVFDLMFSAQLADSVQPFSEWGVNMAMAFFRIRLSSRN